MTEIKSMNNTKSFAYLLLRFTMGVNMLIHGLVRLGSNLEPFAEKMAGDYEGTVLPAGLVRIFAYSVPPLEALIGLLLILGAATVPASAAGILLMAAFVFGKGLVQDWGVVGLLMVYALYFFFLLFYVECNTYSVDNLCKRKCPRDI
ncbi:MAG: DoxX family membrane protein [Candidatus Omnitrophica bacterium]|nr:DoxX family membrane protein [Candidatus Omnitrophota bacterium]